MSWVGWRSSRRSNHLACSARCECTQILEGAQHACDSVFNQLQGSSRFALSKNAKTTTTKYCSYVDRVNKGRWLSNFSQFSCALLCHDLFCRMTCRSLSRHLRLESSLSAASIFTVTCCELGVPKALQKVES